jgi:hypothetical protein
MGSHLKVISKVWEYCGRCGMQWCSVAMLSYNVEVIGGQSESVAVGDGSWGRRFLKFLMSYCGRVGQ